MSQIKWRTSVGPQTQTGGLSATTLTHAQMDNNFFALEQTTAGQCIAGEKALITDTENNLTVKGRGLFGWASDETTPDYGYIGLAQTWSCTQRQDPGGYGNGTPAADIGNFRLTFATDREVPYAYWGFSAPNDTQVATPNAPLDPGYTISGSSIIGGFTFIDDQTLVTSGDVHTHSGAVKMSCPNMWFDQHPHTLYKTVSWLLGTSNNLTATPTMNQGRTVIGFNSSDTEAVPAIIPTSWTTYGPLVKAPAMSNYGGQRIGFPDMTGTLALMDTLTTKTVSGSVPVYWRADNEADYTNCHVTEDGTTQRLTVNGNITALTFYPPTHHKTSLLNDRGGQQGSLTNHTVGIYTLIIDRSGGSYTVPLGSSWTGYDDGVVAQANIYWSDEAPAFVSTASSGVDIVRFFWDGSDYYALSTNYNYA